MSEATEILDLVRRLNKGEEKKLIAVELEDVARRIIAKEQSLSITNRTIMDRVVELDQGRAVSATDEI